jgi:hypothetical protein
MKLYRRAGRPAVAFVVALVVAALGLASIADAREDALMRSSIEPVRYHFEIEPHLVLGTAPPGAGQGSGIGAGVRASGVILQNGIIRNGHDSVAIGFGLDYGRYYGSWALNGYQDRCLRYAVGPNDTQVCTEVTLQGGKYTYLYLPVVIQWNLRLTRRLSAFAEPGVDVYYLGDHGFSVVPAGYVGGRVQLSHRIALTARIGYPTLAIGASFML